MITGDEFGQLFRTFKHTAFRLEVRDRYDASYENASLAKFLNGEEDDLPWMQDWLAMIREATKRGRRFSRVRVVSTPLTDYSRFGVWCAQFTIPRRRTGRGPRHCPTAQPLARRRMAPRRETGRLCDRVGHRA
ncbi:DUF6879 family protein [Streptomyces niveus]